MKAEYIIPLVVAAGAAYFLFFRKKDVDGRSAYQAEQRRVAGRHPRDAEGRERRPAGT